MAGESACSPADVGLGKHPGAKPLGSHCQALLRCLPTISLVQGGYEKLGALALSPKQAVGVGFLLVFGLSQRCSQGSALRAPFGASSGRAKAFFGAVLFICSGRHGK